MTNLHVTRLQPGADLRSAIATFVREQGITAGVVVSSVGNLTKVVVRLADATPGYTPLLEREGPFEIVSLNGTVGTDDLHLHISVADSDGQVIGGHLRNGCVVWVTVELVIAADPNLKFDREPDAQTGYEELSVKKLK